VLRKWFDNINNSCVLSYRTVITPDFTSGACANDFTQQEFDGILDGGLVDWLVDFFGFVVEGESDFDGGGHEGIGAVDADYVSVFDAGEAAFVFGEGFGAGEVDFEVLSFADGGFQGQNDQGPAGGYIDAASVEEPCGFGMPDAYGPLHGGTGGLTLFVGAYHSIILSRDVTSKSLGLIFIPSGSP